MKRRTLPCGCSYSIDKYDDVLFCADHNSYDQIDIDICNDIKQLIIDKFINHIKGGEENK